MFRKLASALLVLLFAVSMFAKERSVTPPAQDDGKIALGNGASVTGEVSSVNGTLITLAGGVVALDATNAKIVSGDRNATVASIKPGMLIVATVNEPSTISTAPLVATAIAVLRSADVTLTGTVQLVDPAGTNFLLLNKTIKVDANTTFVNANGIADVRANSLVVVEANASGSALLASRVTVAAPIPPRPQTATGIVKSIGSSEWVITVRDRDTTFVVNANTKILGDPKVGDKVEVLYTVDSAHANVAIAIAKHVVIDVPQTITVRGVVKSLGTEWILARDEDGKEFVIVWPEFVRIAPAVQVGDHVSAVLVERPDGKFTLISIKKIS